MTAGADVVPRPPGRVLTWWPAALVAHRAGRRWRPLAVLALVTLLVSTLVGTLTLLVVRSEAHAVRAALDAAPAGATEVAVEVARPTVPLTDLEPVIAEGVTSSLGRPATPAGTSAMTVVERIPREGRGAALGWVAVLDGLEDRATLLEGTWPVDPSGAGPVPVAAHEAAAEVLDLDVGDTIDLVDTRAEITYSLEVVGIFRVAERDDPWWSRDRLGGRGHEPAYPVPGSAGFAFTDLVGPFVGTSAGLDATGLAVTEVATWWTPDLDEVGAADLGPLATGLADGELVVADVLERRATNVRWDTDLDDLVSGAAASVVVTRSGVVVVGLLLLALAVATLVQSARLLAEARKGEHDLMRARGAARRQLVAVTALEALLVGGGAAAVGAVAAVGLHAVLVGGSTLAGSAGGAPGPASWAVAAAVALVVGVVTVSPLVGSGDTFVESEQAQARPGRRAALVQVGTDGVLLVLAVIAFWQLSTYRTPVGTGAGGLTVDPVIVAAPTVILLAVTLLSLRLLPAGARVAERLAARSSGLVAPLASWEIGRRSARAGTAVLLLAMTVGVGTYGQSFLRTWEASQVDQAAYAVGAPVVVKPPGSAAAAAVALGTGLPDGGSAEPVVRRSGRTTPWLTLPGGRRSGLHVDVVALTEPARDLLGSGRVGEEGGTAVGALPAPPPADGDGVALPQDAVGLTGTLVAESAQNLAGASVVARVLLEDAAGLVSAVHLPITRVGSSVPVDVTLDGALPPTTGGRWQVGDRPTPLRVVGFQASVLVGDEEAAIATAPPVSPIEIDIVLEDAEALVARDGDREARSAPLDLSGLRLGPQVVSGVSQVGTVGDDALGLRVTGTLTQLLDRPSVGAATVWPTVFWVPAVVTTEVAEHFELAEEGNLRLRIGEAELPIEVHAVVPRVPTVPRDGARVVVVDHALLARAMVLAGHTDAAVDEWWVDVEPGQVDAYLAGLPDDVAGRPLAESATSVPGMTSELTAGPLRVSLPRALWLVTIGAGLVAAVGFAVHTTMTLRSRELELAQLRAVGLQRSRLVAVVAVESMIVCVLGALVGVAVGLLLAHTVTPLISVASHGGAPVPEVLVEIPWPTVGLLVLTVVTVVAATAVGVARSQRTADPAAILRTAAAR